MNYMRHLIKIFLFIILACLPAHSAINERLEYQIPIDYTKLSTEELENQAGFYYNLALRSSNGKVNEDVTAALNLYTMLQRKNPDNGLYSERLGHLYDIIGMDKYAKGCFYAAMECDKSLAESHFRLGEFYYRRAHYKRALKFYKEAYKRGFTTHYETLYKMGDIYEKFGDTEAALKYLKLASEQSPNSELDKKIQRVENANQFNKEYYSDTRIRLIER